MWSVVWAVLLVLIYIYLLAYNIYLILQFNLRNTFTVEFIKESNTCMTKLFYKFTTPQGICYSFHLQFYVYTNTMYTKKNYYTFIALKIIKHHNQFQFIYHINSHRIESYHFINLRFFVIQKQTLLIVHSVNKRLQLL